MPIASYTGRANTATTPIAIASAAVGQHAGFEQVLRDELAAARTDDFTQADLARAARRACGREIRVVHAGDEKHEGSQAEQQRRDRDGSARAAEKLRVELRDHHAAERYRARLDARELELLGRHVVRDEVVHPRVDGRGRYVAVALEHRVGRAAVAAEPVLVLLLRLRLGRRGVRRGGARGALVGGLVTGGRLGAIGCRRRRGRVGWLRGGRRSGGRVEALPQPIVEIPRRDHLEVQRRRARTAEVRRLGDLADYALHGRVDAVAAERDRLAEHVPRAVQPDRGGLAEQHAVWCCERGMRVARDERQIEDVEKLGVHGDRDHARAAAVGRHGRGLTPRICARDRLELRELEPHVFLIEVVRLRHVAGRNAAVAQREARGDHVGAGSIREMSVAVAPIGDDRIGRDECDEPERERRDVDQCRERSAAQVAQRDREIVAEHASDPHGRHDAAVAQMDDPLGARRAVLRVRDHQHGRALAMQCHEHLEHLGVVAAVEAARRLVGEDQRRVVDERPRDRDALLLTARELVREVLAARVRDPRARAPRALACAIVLAERLDSGAEARRSHGHRGRRSDGSSER